MICRTCILSLSLAACMASEPAEQLGEHTSAVCTLTNAGLIETNPAIVNDTSFPLRRVMDAIRSSTPTGTTPPSSPTPMFQQLYAPFATCTSTPTFDPNGYGVACRPAEASLAALDPFATSPTIHYKPVALINRIDLAPADLSYCGESRIVFWKDSGPAGRASIIFEMKTPPAIVAGTSTCQPVFNFWANLSSITAPAARTKALTDFYFKGEITTSTGGTVKLIEPPVSANGAGFGGPGQVRLDSIVGPQWNLRELKWQRVCSPIAGGSSPCTAQFVAQTVKNNPSQRLFAGTHPNAPAFQSWFVNTEVAALATATDRNRIALPDADNFNTFESISQPFAGDPTSVDYSTAASTALRAQISTRLTAIGSSLTATDVLNRATTQTCGGCHQVSANVAIGGGLVWPFSNGFTMIDESAHLAPALTDVFLPFRLQLLESLTCPSVGPSPAVAPSSTLTISGRPAGAPN